ncbi:MAG: VWA domain-containing protein [Elusimicrobia bacterium]|nr:VWA domain-containing protein [Candidatus Obscuribacterium magneticum]
MRFANPDTLWFLLFVPLMASYLAFFRAQDLPTFLFSSLKKMGDLAKKQRLDVGLWMIGGLRLAAVTLIIFALARPQKGLRSEELTAKATDIMLVLDASRSMTCIDFKPQNRFQMAKQVISEFTKGREHDRLGLVVFAEHAITQCPLTLDINALLSIVDQLEIGVIPQDQTAIGDGIATAVNRLKNSIAKSKVMILVTDGSNNAGTIDPLTAAKTATAFNIKIYTIGAGSPEGGLMPIDDPVFGQRLVQSGNDLDEDTLLKIAGETNAKYFRAKTSGALKEIFKEIDSLEKTDIKTKSYVDYEDLFIWFLLPAVFLLLAELTLAKTIFRTVP